MADKCDYCRTADAEMWLSIGSYGIDESIGVCAAEDCIDKARVTMMDHGKTVKCQEEVLSQIPVLEGRRCPKCQSLMIHTRLGGYRCQRGCR